MTPVVPEEVAVANKDKGKGKGDKKTAQKGIKEKRAAKKQKKASK